MYLDGAPLREPPITADPLGLREQTSLDRDDLDPDRGGDETWDRSDLFLPWAPEVPPPLVLDDALAPCGRDDEGD